MALTILRSFGIVPTLVSDLALCGVIFWKSLPKCQDPLMASVQAPLTDAEFTSAVELFQRDHSQ